MVTTLLFDAIQKIGARGIGPRLRTLGFKIYKAGIKLGATDITYETVLPKAERVKVGDQQPQIGAIKLLGQGTSIIGDVNIGNGCTIQFNSTIQAGPNGAKINIGQDSSIGDLVIIKADQGQTVNIGKNALIGSNAYLQNCAVRDNGIIGSGAKAYDGSVIEGMLGAGSVLLEGEIVPEGEIWVGNPAIFIRRMTEDEQDYNKDLVFQYSRIGEIVTEEMEKLIEEQMLLDEIRDSPIEGDAYMHEYREEEMARNEGLPFATEDFINAKRVMDLEQINDLQVYIEGKNLSEDYAYNYENHPRNFNNHKPNYKIHNELKNRIETDADIQRPDFSVLEKEGEIVKPESFSRKY